MPKGDASHPPAGHPSYARRQRGADVEWPPLGPPTPQEEGQRQKKMAERYPHAPQCVSPGTSAGLGGLGHVPPEGDASEGWPRSWSGRRRPPKRRNDRNASSKIPSRRSNDLAVQTTWPLHEIHRGSQMRPRPGASRAQVSLSPPTQKVGPGPMQENTRHKTSRASPCVGAAGTAQLTLRQ